VLRGDDAYFGNVTEGDAEQAPFAALDVENDGAEAAGAKDSRYLVTQEPEGQWRFCNTRE